MTGLPRQERDAGNDGGAVLRRDDDPDHVGFRTVLVTDAGEALYAASGGDLFGFTPGAKAPLSPDGSTLYYIPDAHGSAWTTGDLP